MRIGVDVVQASALYILRTAVIESLNEASQRALLLRLVALLARPACPVPTAVVALEGRSEYLQGSVLPSGQDVALHTS
jgi:hypothetical protein